MKTKIILSCICGVCGLIVYLIIYLQAKKIKKLKNENEILEKNVNTWQKQAEQYKKDCESIVKAIKEKQSELNNIKQEKEQELQHLQNSNSDNVVDGLNQL